MNFGYAFMALAGYMAGIVTMVLVALYMGHKDDR